MKTDIPFHEAADIFPLLNEADLDDLAHDIATNGQHEAILLYDGMIIDGRNRYLACEIAGVEPRFEEWEGEPEELVPFVMSLNLHRRHLTTSQRSLVAARLANMERGGDRKSEEIKAQNCGLITQEKAADILAVSERSVQQAAAVIRDGTPEQIKAIESGESTVNAELQKIKQALKDAEKDKAAKDAEIQRQSQRLQKLEDDLEQSKIAQKMLADLKKPDTVTVEKRVEVIPPDYETTKQKLKEAMAKIDKMTDEQLGQAQAIFQQGKRAEIRSRLSMLAKDVGKHVKELELLVRILPGDESVSSDLTEIANILRDTADAVEQMESGVTIDAGFDSNVWPG